MELSCLVYFRAGWRWVGTLYPPVTNAHTAVIRGGTWERILVDGSLHTMSALSVQTSYSSLQQKGNRSPNKSQCGAARSWRLCVFSGWLCLWWSTSSPWWLPQIARKSFVMLFSVLIKTKITLWSPFCCVKIHLITSLCNCNYIVFPPLHFFAEAKAESCGVLRAFPCVRCVFVSLRPP